MGARLKLGLFKAHDRSHTGLTNSHLTPGRVCADFSCEPSFLSPPRAVAYERFVTATCLMSPEANWLHGWRRRFLNQRPHLTLDRGNLAQAFQPGSGMVNRLTPPQSTGAMRRWGSPAIAMLTAMAALTALNADAAARQARPAATVEATAPREAG